MKNFLNRDMEQYRNIDDKDVSSLRNGFRNALSITKSLLGEHSFHRFIRGRGEDHRHGNWEVQKYNVALYDILMGCFSYRQKSEIQPHLDSLREALVDLMTGDEEFLNSIDRYTDGARQVAHRFRRWEETIDRIIGRPHREPRQFSMKLKETLYLNDPTCKLCDQRIHTIDDASVDHIKQYWLGGKTIPSNASLSHRYCNFARSKKE